MIRLGTRPVRAHALGTHVLAPPCPPFSVQPPGTTCPVAGALDSDGPGDVSGLKNCKYDDDEQDGEAVGGDGPGGVSGHESYTQGRTHGFVSLTQVEQW